MGYDLVAELVTGAKCVCVQEGGCDREAERTEYERSFGKNDEEAAPAGGIKFSFAVGG